MKTVAVTGAAGFIGSRVVALLRQRAYQVRPFVHRRGRDGYETLVLEREAVVGQALAGCDAVVHCAFDFHDLPANLRMIQVLAEACARQSVRLVLLSTAAVYEPFPAEPFDETAAIEPSGVPYSDTKIAMEKHVLQQVGALGLDVVILQPTVVYGPHGRQWTDTLVRELLTGRVILPDNGNGICNAVYVDDVCAAAIAAIDADIPPGERFIISGPEPVTWHRFYSGLRSALGFGAISCIPLGDGVSSALKASALSPARAVAVRLASRVLRSDTRARIKFALQRILPTGRAVIHAPHGAKLDLYASRGIAVIAKARRLLHWEPSFDFAAGMAPTTDYVRSAFSSEIAAGLRRQAPAQQDHSATRSAA